MPSDTARGLQMSPDCVNDPQWERIGKHRLANCRLWNNGKARAISAKPRGPSQYYPYVYSTDEAIKAIEMRCYKHGTPMPHGFAKYLHVGHVVGVCMGHETEYVFAECCSGFVHGRPISDVALRIKGVVI